MPSKPAIVLTRPALRQQGLVEVLTGYGLHVLALPALSVQAITPVATTLTSLTTTPPTVVATSTTCVPSITALSDQSGAKTYDLIVFVSRAAVEHFPLDFGVELTSTLLAAVGGQTAHTIRQRFGHEATVLCPLKGDQQDSEALWQVLVPHLTKVHRVLIVRAEKGRNWLCEQFLATNCQVDCLAVYAREPCFWSTEQVKDLNLALQSKLPLIWLFTSTESVDAIEAQFNLLDVSSTHAIQGVVVTHPRVLERVRRFLATTVSVDLLDLQTRDGCGVTPCLVVAPNEPAMVQGLLKLSDFFQS
jgi:uroporphyrinogen-III synthase